MAKKSETLSIRLGRDLLEYIEDLRDELDPTDEEEENGKYVSNSDVLRRIIDFHRHLMRSPLSEILKDPGDMTGDVKKILDDGKITIPKDIREELGLEKGDVVSLNSDGSSNLVLSKVQIERD